MIEDKDTHYDVIVIGSGLSGLTTAGLLTKINKKKVLVLERHYEIGGLTHEFKRGPYSWDIGLHYIGNMEKRLIDKTAKTIFDYLTDSKLKWNNLPKIFDKLIFPDFTINIEESLKGYKNAILKEFPDEKKSFNKYLKDVKKLRRWYLFYFFSKFFHHPLKLFFKIMSLFNKKLATMSTLDYLNKNIKNEKLKATLQARFGNYGLFPQDSAFAIHAVIEHHYFVGAVFPDQGAERIASLIENTIETSGGRILVSREVTEILIKNNKAYGVKVKNLADKNNSVTEYYAPCIISAAGAENTYLKLLPESLNLPVQKKLKNFPRGYSAIDIYLGLKDSPEKLGVKGENYWIYDSYDLDLIRNNHLNNDNKECLFCFLSFPSLKSKKPGGYTADIVTIIKDNIFDKWKDQEWKNKKPDYYLLKEKFVDSILNLVNKYVPGLKDLIVYKEAASPLTFEHFTNQKNGLFYGLPAFPEKYKINEIEVKTPVKNLYLTGTDLLTNGIVPALLSALATISYLNGLLGIVKIVSKAILSNFFKNKKSISVFNTENYSESEDKASAVLIGKEKTAEHLLELKFRFKKDLTFIPGQHVKLLVGEGEWRAYSIAKTEENILTLVVDIRQGGIGANYVTNILIGEKSLFRMPITDLIYHPSDRKLFFISTGTGLMPFIYMLDELKKNNQKKEVISLFGCMNEKEDISEMYLKDYIKFFNIKNYVCVEKPDSSKEYYKGRVTDFLIEKEFNTKEYDFYVCGHPHMTDAVVKLLRSQKADKIYY